MRQGRSGISTRLPGRPPPVAVAPGIAACCDSHGGSPVSRRSQADEQKRGKAHWDHVMEEMQWLAKEFMKVRLRCQWPPQ